MNERMKPTSPLPIALLVAAFTVLATTYNVVVPVFEAPDEHAHYYFAQHVAQTGRLPVQTKDPDARGPWEQEGSQPPLYYLLVAPLVRLTGADLRPDDLWYNDQNTMGHPALVGNENRFIHPPDREGWPWHGYALAVHLARALSTLLGALTVWLVWLIARRVFPTRPWLALATAAVVAFTPQFLFVSASLTNDNLIILLATATLALLLRLADEHDDRATVLVLALVVGLAPLAKLSGLAVLGFALLTLVWLAWRKPGGRWFLRTAGFVVLAALVFSGWWYLRNMALYGDVTGIAYMHPGGTRRHEPLAHWLAGLPDELYGVWLSTWGLFGWFTVMLPSSVYLLMAFLAFAALTGVLIALDQRVKWIEWHRLGWLVLWGVIVIASLVRWLAVTKGGQGRLLFPAIAVLAVLLVTGWRKLAGEWIGDRVFTGCVVVGMAAFAVYSLQGGIRPAYAMAPTIAESEIPATAKRVDVVFDERLRLVAIEHPASVVEGETVPVTLYWQVLKPIERDGYVGLRMDQSLKDELISGQANLEYPGAGTSPPKLWMQNADVHVDRHMITAPKPAAVVAPEADTLFGPLDRYVRRTREPQRLPLLGRLAIQVYDPAPASPWPISSGTEPGGAEWSTDLIIEPRNKPNVQQGRGVEPVARLENGIELYHASADYSLLGGPPKWRTQMRSSPVCIKVGQLAAEQRNRRLPLLWRAVRPVDEDLTAFVHLEDLGGRIVAQADGPPASYGRFPTSSWRAGDWLPVEVSWEIPSDVQVGKLYQLQLGLYRPSDGTRIPAFRADGRPWPNDALAVQELVVLPDEENCP